MPLIDHPAARFLTEIARATEAIEGHPGRWRIVEGNLRCYRLARFPYSILYGEVANGLKVFAYKHDRRQPGYWLDRLND